MKSIVGKLATAYADGFAMFDYTHWKPIITPITK